MVILSMITRNSYSELGEVLLKVLDSSLQIPYKAFILVDDSTDDTSNIIKRWCVEHGKEAVVSRSRLYGFGRPTRATARQTAIDMFFESFNDPWLMFLDDDAVLNGGWWAEASKHLSDGRVGIVWGLNYDVTPFREILLRRFGVDYRAYLIKQFEVRGGTHDTLLRREALKGISIPPELHVLEDAYIKHYVCCRGYEYRVVAAGIKHMNPGRKTPKEVLDVMAKYALKLGLEDPRYRNPLFSIYALARTTAGIPLTILTYRSYGTTGLKEGLNRARNKWLYRLYLLKHSLKTKPPKNTCEEILRKL